MQLSQSHTVNKVCTRLHTHVSVIGKLNFNHLNSALVSILLSWKLCSLRLEYFIWIPYSEQDCAILWRDWQKMTYNLSTFSVFEVRAQITVEVLCLCSFHLSFCGDHVLRLGLIYCSYVSTETNSNFSLLL